VAMLGLFYFKLNIMMVIMISAVLGLLIHSFV